MKRKERKTTNMSFLLHIATVLALIAVLGIACEEPLEEELEYLDEGDLGTQQQPILDGDDADHVAYGAPMVEIQRWVGDIRVHWQLCSSTLITNKIALTAKHCVDTYFDEFETIKTNNQYYLHFGGEKQKVVRVYRHDSEDVAAYVVADGFEIDGKTSGYSRDIYPDSNFSLHGDLVVCTGWGVNTNSNSGAMVFRKALFNVDAFFWKLEFPMNDSGQNVAPGDSGGSCFTMKSNYPSKGYSPGDIISINTHVDQWPFPTKSLGPGPDQIRDFVEHVLDEETPQFAATVYKRR